MVCLDHISRIWVRIKLKIMMTIELATTALVEAAPHFERVALGVVAVEGRNRGDDEGENGHLDKCVGDRVGSEVV